MQRMLRNLRWVALAAIALAPTAGRAQDEAATKEDDLRVNRAVVGTLRTGVQLYNSGDQAGCYRVYQGALMGLAPHLDYRPELRAAVEAGLKQADTLPSPGQRAFALRKVLDELYAATMVQKPLWDRLGGEPAVRAVIHDFVARAATNPKVDFTRGGQFQVDVPKLEQLLVELVSATTGGPIAYTGRDMKSSHEGMKITEAQFGALAGDLIAVLKKYNVPQRETDELIAIVASTQPDIVEDGGAGAPGTKPLWDRLGGEPAVKAVVHAFVVKAATNPDVDFTRGGQYQVDVPKLEQLLVEFVSSATGGPLKYTGRDMKSSHEGMKITEAQFNAIAGDLIAVLNEFQVPQAEIDELVGIVGTTKDAIVEVK